MIFLSTDYINKLRTIQAFDIQIRNELFCSILFNNIVDKKNFILGSTGDIPDLINRNKTCGYEITQCDLDIDLNLKYIADCLLKNNYNYQAFLSNIKCYGVDIKIDDYFFICEKENVKSYGPKLSAREPYYYLKIFRSAFQKKIEKLNKNNYKDSLSTSLIVLSINRFKDGQDASAIFDEYFKIINDFDLKFANLYLITSSKIYKSTSDGKFDSINISSDDISHAVSLTNKILSSIAKKKTLYSEAPELCLEWGENQKTPLDYGNKSGEKVMWICDKGHSYDAVINKRTMRRNGCPYCSGHRVLSGFNDLVTTHPQLVKQWHPTKNGELKPSNFSKGSMQVVWWICPNGHSYKNNINAKKETNDCPYCNHRIIEQGVTDLATTNPELAKEWHPTKNGALKPTDVFAKSDRKVWWLCKQGHSYKASIHHRVSDKTGCPECLKERKVSFPEKLLYFYLSNCFSDVYENYNAGLPNNGNIDIYLKKFNIGIEYDGEHWHKNAEKDIQKSNNCKALGISLIRIREKGCPIINSSSYDHYIDADDYSSALKFIKECLKNIAGIDFIYDFDLKRDSTSIDELIFSKTKENSLTNYPNLLKEWDYEKNKNINPAFISSGSDKQFWWKCEHGHFWKTSVLNRTQGKGCPYCYNRLLLKGYNDLATTNPLLVREWDFGKNDKKPDEVMKGSAKKVWWKCKHGHSYLIELREKKEGYCPVCEMNIIQKGINDLPTLFPELMKEWDYEKNTNVSPQGLSPYSNKKVWWKCSACGNSWEQRIYRRTKENTKCPSCHND